MGFAAGTFRGIALASAALLSGIAGGAPAVATGVQAAGQWPVYANARYGYRICYPAALLKPAAEAPNGDGRQFNGPGGAVLRVWGSNNALGDTVAASAGEDRKRLTRGGAGDLCGDQAELVCPVGAAGRTDILSEVGAGRWHVQHDGIALSRQCAASMGGGDRTHVEMLQRVVMS